MAAVSPSAWEEAQELEKLQTGGHVNGGSWKRPAAQDEEPAAAVAAAAAAAAANAAAAAAAAEHDEFEVGVLLGHRSRHGRLEYRVRWRGFSAADDTWEPASNLLGASLKVSQYNARHGIGSPTEEGEHDEAEDDSDSDGSEGGVSDDDVAVETNDDMSADSSVEEEDDDGEEEEERVSPNAHAESLVGKWLNYRFEETAGAASHDGSQQNLPDRWYNCKVLSAGAPGKTRGRKRRGHKEWLNWVNVQFEDGETMHMLVSPSTEGDVWRRGKTRTKQRPVAAAEKTAKKRGSGSGSDATERKLRRLMAKDAAADVAPQENMYHPVYNPATDGRASKAKAVPRVEWEQTAVAMGGELSARSLMQLWARMQEREAPPVESAVVTALGLHPLGDDEAARGASLPLTFGEVCIVEASHDTENERMLIDAANASGVCPGCLRQLLLHARCSQTLCWMQTRPATPGHCLVCKCDVSKPHKPAQAASVKKKRNKSRPVVNADKIEHRFQWQGTKWKWYSGQVQSRAKWGSWYNVEFEDGETLAVNLTNENEGSVWRHHSTPSLITLPGDASATFIRAAIKAAGKATEKLTKQAEEERKQRQSRREAAARQEAAAQRATSSTALYPQLAPGFSGNAATYWSPVEDKKLMQCVSRHTPPDHFPHHSRWGWKETSTKVGRSAASCRLRAELLGDLAAGVRTAVIRPSNTEGTGIDTTRMPLRTGDLQWNPDLDSKLCSAAAMRVVRENDHPGKRGAGSGAKTVISGWDEISEHVGKSGSSCRHRWMSMYKVRAAGQDKEVLVCTLCSAKFKTYRSLLLHNQQGNMRDCASSRGYWMCKRCCRPFLHKSAYTMHERACEGPAPMPEPEDQKGEQNSAKSRRLADGKSSSSSAAAATKEEKPPPSLRVVASSFFSSEEVEKKMRKRTWQSSTSEEARLSRWSTGRIPIAVRDTQTVKGFGAFASRDIRANEMLGEYAGEIIDAKELRKRQKRHEEQMAKQKPEPPPDMIEGMSAAAKAATVAGPAKRKRGEAALTDEQLASRLTGRHYVFDLGCGLSVDASHAGNSTRYLNHATAGSDEANVRAQVTNHFGIRRVVFYACRDIKVAEELCYDYGEGFKRDCGIKLI